MRKFAVLVCLTAVLTAFSSCVALRDAENAPGVYTADYPALGEITLPDVFDGSGDPGSSDSDDPGSPLLDLIPEAGDPVPSGEDAEPGETVLTEEIPGSAESSDEQAQQAQQAEQAEQADAAVPETQDDPVQFPELTPPKTGFAANPVSVTFIAAGDNLIHPNIYLDAGLRGYDGKPYDFLPMYADVRDKIAAADVAFLNQETVMAGEEYGYSGYPCFNCPRQLGLDLVDIGFDVVNLANNHMLDKGAGGLEATIEFWNSQPVTQLGGYLDEQDSETVRVTETNGVRFAWLSYTYGTNGITKPESSPLVVPYIGDDVLLRDLTAAEEAGDFTIVSIHWGDENTQAVNDEQRRLAKLLADNGADVILGHHSHTLEPIEWIETERGRTLCIYSLGNFVSGMANPVNMVGGLLNFTVRSDEQGRLIVDDVVFDPTVFFYGMDWYNTHIYPIDSYTANISPNHGLAISGYTLSPDKAMEYVTNVMDDEFLRK